MTDLFTRTTCPYCGVGCGVSVRQQSSDAGIELLPVAGDEQHPANRGRLCVKGSALHETVGTRRRLLRPEINGAQVDWSQALDEVSSRLQRTIRDHGPGAVALYLSGQLLTEDYYVANKLWKGFIGSSNVDTNSRLCMSSAVAAHNRAFGEDVVPACYDDLELADLVVMVGSNAAWAHPVLHQRLLRAKQARPNMKLVVIDPRRTESCDQADLHLPIAPGSDAFLFNGLLTWLADNDAIDVDYIGNHTNGFEAAIASARHTSPSVDIVAAACGVDAGAVALFYSWFAQNARTVTLFSQGINQSSSGTDKGNAIINCHLATGRVGKPGASPFSITGQPNAMGGREVGGLANMLAVHRNFTPDAIDAIGSFWRAPNMALQPGLKAIPLFEAIERGEVKFLWIMATNPLVSMPEADRWREALKQCETVVVSDCVRNTDTTQLAHILLPATGWGEKNGTVTNSERTISRQRPFLPAAGEARPDWQIICDVAKRIGFANAFDYGSAYEIFVEYAALSGINRDSALAFDISALSALSKSEYDSLQPMQWPVRRDGNAFSGSKRLYGDGNFSTADRRANFIAIEPRWPQSSETAEHPLVLNTGRVRDHWHTMTRTAESERLNRHRAEPYVEMHPQDADQYGFAPGDIIELHNSHGSALLKLRIEEGQRRGSLFAPMHWNDQFAARARVDALVTAHVDPHSGQPELKHARVAARRFDVRWHGLLVSREPLPLPRDLYWAGFPASGGWVYWLAGGEPLVDAQQRLAALLPGEPELLFDDIAHHGIRCGWLQQEQLQAVLMLAQNHTADDDMLPEPWWLLQRLGEKPGDSERRVLLSGQPPGARDVDNSAMICSCFQVSEASICAAITAGACSADQLGQQLRCGTNCGSCVPELNRLLRIAQASNTALQLKSA
jgi:assimilatory nitrate reductase catalytic subunit